MTTSVPAKLEWTPEQMKLITDTVAKNASPDELKLFLYRARNMGLDPLKPGQIHFIKYNPNSPGTIVVGIEGFRVISERTGKKAGVKRGSILNAAGETIGGWCEVYRHDWKEPARIEVSLREYSTGRPPWSKMPDTMIQKVAECAALRMAFPDVLGGVYEQAEMDQAARPGVYSPQPEPEDGCEFDEESYKVDFGQWNKRSLEEIHREHGPRKMADYIAYLEKPEIVAKRKPEHVARVARFIEECEKFLGEKENAAVGAMREPGSDG